MTVGSHTKMTDPISAPSHEREPPTTIAVRLRITRWKLTSAGVIVERSSVVRAPARPPMSPEIRNE